jgi:hypothetical protein
MESHVFSDPIPVLTADCPTWRIEIRRKHDDNEVVVGTLEINHLNFPPRRKSAQGKILWKLPDTMESTPRFGDHEKKRLWELYKNMKKQRRRQQQQQQQQEQQQEEPVENNIKDNGEAIEDAPPSSNHHSSSQEPETLIPPPPGFSPPKQTIPQVAPSAAALTQHPNTFWIPFVDTNNTTSPSILLSFLVANSFEKAMNFRRVDEGSRDSISQSDHLDVHWMRYYYHDSTDTSINHPMEPSSSIPAAQPLMSLTTVPSHTIMMGTAQARAHGIDDIRKQWNSLVLAPSDSSNVVVVGGWQISNHCGTIATNSSSAVVVLTGQTHQPTTGCLFYTLTVVLEARSDKNDHTKKFEQNGHTKDMQQLSLSKEGTAYSIIHTILTMCAISPLREGL